MCTISMVYDHYSKIFPAEPLKWIDPSSDWKQIIEDFRKATEAAQVVDTLTNQKDCADPEKAKLEERVQELEKEIKKLKQRKKNKKKKK